MKASIHSPHSKLYTTIASLPHPHVPPTPTENNNQGQHRTIPNKPATHSNKGRYIYSIRHVFDSV